MIIVFGIFLAQWVWLFLKIVCSYSKWDVCHLSPGGLSEMTCCDIEEGKQKCSPLHPVCGSIAKSRPLFPQLLRELWLAERMQWGMKGEFTGHEAHLVLLHQACRVRVRPGHWDVNFYLSNWMLSIEFECTRQASQCMQVPSHISFLCPESAPSTGSLGRTPCTFRLGTFLH